MTTCKSRRGRSAPSRGAVTVSNRKDADMCLWLLLLPCVDTEQNVAPAAAAVPARQVDDATRLGQRLGDVLARLDLSQLHHPVARLHRVLDQRGGLRLGLSLDDLRQLLLLRPLHNELVALGVLLRDLLLLDSLRELVAKGQRRDRDVPQLQAELLGALCEVVPDVQRDLRSGAGALSGGRGGGSERGRARSPAW